MFCTILKAVFLACLVALPIAVLLALIGTALGGPFGLAVQNAAAQLAGGAFFIALILGMSLAGGCGPSSDDEGGG